MRSKHLNALIFLIFSLLITLLLLSLCFLERILILPIGRDASTSPTVTVVLDAGHGGEDGGATHGKIYEKDLNLDITKSVGAYLSQSGINVVYTRTEDVLLYSKSVNYKGRKKILDLAARLRIARQTDNAVFVSIHMNSFPEEKYKGLQVYYSKNHKNSKIMAQTIQNNVKNLLQPTNNRKSKEATSAIYLLDRLERPAVLIECGFLSNAEDRSLLSTPEYRQKLSLIIAESLAQYLHEMS